MPLALWSLRCVRGLSRSNRCSALDLLRSTEIGDAPRRLLHRTAGRRSAALVVRGLSAGGSRVSRSETRRSAWSDIAIEGMETPNTTQVSTIVGREDRYHGIIVDPDSLPSTLDSFMIHMEAALEAWRATRKRGIWLKIPIEKASFIGPAVDTFNFKFHHAEEDFVMCLKWLPKEPGNIPPNASHQVGVGAFVMNDRGQVLAVQEKNGPLKGMGVWKMPTGVVNAGEDIGEGAEREVMEETGICASFDSVLCIRQAHGVAFGKSDMFFVCGMKAHPGQETFMPQASEIEAVQWMDLDEITRQEFVQGRPVIRETFEACRLYMAGEYRGLVGGRIQDGVRRTPYFFLRGRASNEDPSAKL